LIFANSIKENRRTEYYICPCILSRSGFIRDHEGYQVSNAVPLEATVTDETEDFLSACTSTVNSTCAIKDIDISESQQVVGADDMLNNDAM